jgi:hypothetical protein
VKIKNSWCKRFAAHFSKTTRSAAPPSSSLPTVRDSGCTRRRSAPPAPIRSAAGLAPEASGAAVFAKWVARNLGKISKQVGPRVRNVPGDTPNPLKRTPTEEAVEDALKQCVETLADIVTKIGEGGASILTPVPDIILYPKQIARRSRWRQHFLLITLRLNDQLESIS